MKTWHSKVVAVVVGILALSPGAYAGQGQFYSASGKPYIWPNGTISWVSDLGALSKSCDNACAVKMITDAFAVWSSAGLQKDATSGAIPTADITSIHKGQTGEDMTAANYENYVSNTTTPPTFIFDEDGSIIKEECKNVDCSPDAPIVTKLHEGDLDTANNTIKHSVVILSGPQYELYEKMYGKDMFFAALVHEMGFLLGLDNSGLGWELVSKPYYNLKSSMDQGIPTMFPILATSSVKDLHKDDVVAISTLYPKGDVLTSQFCTITGQITDVAGKGIQGLQVEASAFGTVGLVTDAVTTMTGVNYPIPTNDGHYTIRGLVPQQKYSVAFSQLPTFGNTTLSSIGHWYNFETKVTTNSPKLATPAIPNADPDICLPNFPGCAITAANGSIKTVSCDKGGQTIVMDPVKLSTVTIDGQYASAPTPSGTGTSVEGLGTSTAKPLEGICSKQDNALQNICKALENNKGIESQFPSAWSRFKHYGGCTAPKPCVGWECVFSAASSKICSKQDNALQNICKTLDNNKGIASQFPSAWSRLKYYGGCK